MIGSFLLGALQRARYGRALQLALRCRLQILHSPDNGNIYCMSTLERANCTGSVLASCGAGGATNAPTQPVRAYLGVLHLLAHRLRRIG